MMNRHVAWVLLLAPLVCGCLGKLKLEDRWTRLDIVDASTTPGQSIAPGAVQTITMRTSITYRSILTGFAVAELRASSTVNAASVEVFPGAARLPMAQDIDYILQNSVSVGRATRAVTGWDHLIQEIDFSFAAAAPASVGGSGTTGLFLVTYLADGQEIELANGSDSLVITPFNSEAYEILPIGMELYTNSGPQL